MARRRVYISNASRRGPCGSFWWKPRGEGIPTKRGGGAEITVIFDDTSQKKPSGGDELLALNTALDSLARMNPRQAEMVESRFFGGLDVPETAALLEVSEATVLRDWRAAKAWLANELRQNS